MALNAKQEAFCQQYVIDFNGTQAAIRAGYSPKTANEQAAQLLAKLSISQRVKELQTKAANKLDITKDRILKELAAVSFSDIRAYYKEDGQLKNIADLDDDAAAALAGVNVDEIFDGRGEEKELVGYTKKLKRWDKIKAMAELSKMLGFYAPEKSEVNLTSETDIHIGKTKISRD